MNLDFSFDLAVTKEDILRYISEEDIFCKYMGISHIENKLYSSIIREDKHPSCSFFKGSSGILYLKDFATGDCLDAYNLVMRIYNCDYFESLKIIAGDFGLRGSIKAEKSVLFNKTAKFKTKAPTSIQVEIQDFSENELKWWAQYNINLKLLKKYNVYSCKYVFLNDSVFSKSTDKCPIYGYYFGKKENRELWKIYSPSKSKYKWLCNTPSNIIQGLRQLPHKGDILVITKSLKDVMCLRSIGIPSISANSEHLFLTEELLSKLKSRFKKIVVCYDNDRTGKLNMAKIRREHPDLYYILLPEWTKCKDFTDYVKKVGIDKALRLVKEYINWLNIN